MCRLLNITIWVGVCLLGVLLVSEASAQARRATSRAAGTDASVQSAAGKEGAVIRKMEATGPNARVKTPEFRSDANEPQAQAKDWARILVQYETDTDWTDELEFRYMVLVKHSKTSAFTMFPGTVTYIDIPKGKRHTSTVFLRPTTLERYGNVEWAGVKIYLKGKDTPVAVMQMPENDLRPWTASVTTKAGVLLNRAQTPFAQVAIDNYETIKPK
ncbi:MAG: Amuc_1102 family pilus-like protein [Verrucomicrobiota bacterium]